MALMRNTSALLVAAALILLWLFLRGEKTVPVILIPKAK